MPDVPEFVMANAPGIPVFVAVNWGARVGQNHPRSHPGHGIGVPAIIRDEIKQSMVLATTAREAHYDLPNIPVPPAFFDVLTVLAVARGQGSGGGCVPQQVVAAGPDRAD